MNSRLPCRSLLGIGTVLLLAGCDSRIGHAYPRLDASCEVKLDGAVLFVGEDKCFRAFPMKYFSGTWVTGLEHSAFYSDAPSAPSGLDRDSVWLELSAMPFTQVRSPLTPGEAQTFKVTFLGIDPERDGMYGHFGMSQRGVFVHHFLKIEQIPNRKEAL
jgi:hypothetical protein